MSDRSSSSDLSSMDPMTPLEEVRLLSRILSSHSLEPGVHTNDFAPIYGRGDPNLGHASLANVFRPSLLTFQPILRENLESPVVRSQPITAAVNPDACLNSRWHHGVYKSPKGGCPERVARSRSRLDNVCGSIGAMNAELSRPDLLGTVQSGCKQA